jgi:hypothetical protein
VTPKEWDAVYQLIEWASLQAYKRGQEDQKAGKTEDESRFKLNKASRLTLKTGMEKALRKTR